MAATIVSFLLFFLAFGLPYSHGETWIKAGYWYAGSESPISDINSGLFTHLLCAFADINATTYQLSVSFSEGHYFPTFTDIVKRRNPSVVTLLSIWGGQGPTGLSILGERVNSSMLSLMVRQPSYRKSFIESAMKTARLYGFHGLDLFWLWPNTESDMKNMGALLDELRAAVKLESRNSGKAPLILTMAVHYVPTLYSVSYHIEAIQRNLDWAHIPAYDYYLPSRVNFTHAHAALYDPVSNVSTDFGIREWISKGFPASKLVLGLPCHGYAWTLVNPNHNGIGAPASGIAMTADGSVSYNYIKWFLRRFGATSMYNSTYVVNFVTIGTTWIGFDDVQAIRAKISYAKEKKLLGYNVFQVSNDDNWALSQAAQDDDRDHHKKQELLVKILVPIAALILVAGSITCCYSRSRVLKAIGTKNLGKISLHEVGSKSSGVENFNSNAPNLRVFSFAEIKEATNNFSFENKLGEGGFGPVYKLRLLSSMAATIVSFLLFFLAFGLPYSHGETWIKAGYWYAGSESPIPDINSGLFTHLLCAFADINPTTYQLSISSSEEHYFSTFTDIVKRRNPSIVTLLSIWGGKGPTGLSIFGERVNSSMLSLMVRQPSYRKSFIESAMKTARLYGFHGLDLFWLWPNTESDMKNMGALLDELRAAVKLESRNSSKAPLILTMAVHYVPTLYSVSYHIEAVQRNLDWAHIPAYDYYLPSRVNFTHAHAALYDPLSNVSTDFGIREWISKGFPASKLVLGLPYHGYAWTLVNPNHNGIGAPASGIAMTADGSMSYKYIKWFLRSYGATSMYNATYVVNYVTIGTTWIGFDDVQAIRAKISYAKEKKLLGYNVFQVSNDDNWALSQAAQDDDKDHHKKQELLVKILVPIAALILVAGSITCCYSRSRVLKAIGKISLHEVGSKSSGVENFNSNAPNLRVFSFAEIKEATNNFSFENKLGEGGFGPVYKGKSRKGEEMAVKRLSKTSNQGPEEFINEVTLTAKLQHVNLARLLGFCTEGEEKMLIYEYMPNKSLDFYLFDLTRRYFLDWTKRIAIIEGITQGLLYLQEYSNFTIIHRDLKASNILLDSEMKPKISDFGIARAFQKDEVEASTGRIVGTYGYVPPEYVRRGIYSMKYDVFSFGVLLLQIISSRRNSCTCGLSQNLNLLEYAYELWKEGEGMRFMDPSLDDSSSSCKLMGCMQVALLCIQENPDHRPTMLEVSSMLKSETAAMPAPLRPSFSIKSNEDKLSVNDATISSQQDILSVNDATISDLVPR
ncbi:hypothetical protein PVL29_014530 [Vitis rotundifolia]|uniref:Uncharacterized protein n=1 Tax=Vitis rotundifolia TaxID=103349 RepID=A0AA39DLK1_VITRO|nr:hypothetical protein PVL29_014530 [Vitis rotundifolia]